MIALMMAASLMTTPAPVAGPVYLECQLTGEQDGPTPADAPWNWSITLLENEGRVDYALANGRSYSVAGIFTPTEVRFNSIRISRVDLTMTRVFELLGDSHTSTGRCRVAQPPARAF